MYWYLVTQYLIFHVEGDVRKKNLLFLKFVIAESRRQTVVR
jgi:hypothetical protein